MAWIKVGDLLVADDATTAAQINTSSSLTRAALDGLYDKTAYASQSAAQSGTESTGAMSPLRTRQAFDAWIPGAVAGQRGQHHRQIALWRYHGGSFTHPGASAYAFGWNGGGGWQVTDPGAIVSVDGSWIRVSQDGLYQLSANLAVGAVGSAEDTLTIGWAVAGGTTAHDDLYGLVRATGGGVLQAQSSPPPVSLLAGQSVALLMSTGAPRPVTSAHSSRNRVSVERLGPPLGWQFS